MFPLDDVIMVQVKDIGIADMNVMAFQNICKSIVCLTSYGKTKEATMFCITGMWGESTHDR